MTKVVAITGVSGGIGSATAAAFVAGGWQAIGVDIVDPPPGLALAAFERLDVGSPDAGGRLERLFERAARLDALVNAAAQQQTASIDDTTMAEWDAVLASNARGAFLAMQAAHPSLRETLGAVVNVASVHAIATSDGAASYAASKAALVALTRSAALEWAPEVRVNAVLPGAVDTPMLRKGVQRWAAPDGIEDAIQGLSTRVPLGRIGRPDEIAQAILFLADSDRSSFITGQTLVADGGALARLSTE